MYVFSKTLTHIPLYSPTYIRQSGMDNSPMYYNSFPDPAGGKGIAAGWDNVSNRIQLYDVQMSSQFVAESMALQVKCICVD